jgi:hypothetical protein
MTATDLALVDPPEVVSAAISNKPSREAILRLEAEILKLPQIEFQMRHYFCPGWYAREMFIPRGTVLTGAVHKAEHRVVFFGDITVWTDDGMQRITGYREMSSAPGIKRVGYAHADTWCTGFFETDETDIRKLEELLVEDAHLLQGNRTLEMEDALCLA